MKNRSKVKRKNTNKNDSILTKNKQKLNPFQNTLNRSIFQNGFFIFTTTKK